MSIVQNGHDAAINHAQSIYAMNSETVVHHCFEITGSAHFASTGWMISCTWISLNVLQSLAL